MYGFCNLWMCVCVCARARVFVMCGCFDNCVGLLVICLRLFTVSLCCFVYLFVFVTNVRATATE